MKYPPNWEKHEIKDGYFVLSLGNPLSGLKTYALQVLVVSSDKEHFLNLEPRFQKESEIKLGSINCDVQPSLFDFDQITYFVLCRQSNYTYVIQFPNGEENKDNPNVNDSVANSQIAAQILSTFRFLE